MASVCWNCSASSEDRFCPACGTLQPPATDYFVFFGIPRKLAPDLKDLEQRYYALCRRLHPDLFARKTPREREYAVESSAVLNDAWRTLKDNIRRALYVLGQEGFDVAEQGTKDVPAELLEEVFELNIALDELKDGDDSARPQIAAAKKRFESMRDETDLALNSAFRAWDAGGGTTALADIRRILNRRKYITNLIERTEAGGPNVSD